MNSESKKRRWAGRIITFLAAAPFLLSGTMKFIGSPQVLQGFEHLGWPSTLVLRLAILEATCVILYLLPATSVLGGILLTGYLGGAIATHVRIGEPVAMHAIIGILIWLGIFLRDARLGELLPIRGKGFHYQREIVIGRSREEVFRYLRPLGNFRNWNPFLRKEPDAKVTTRGKDGEVGYVSRWEGLRVGIGEQEVIRIVDGDRVDFELRFEKPFRATNQGYFSVESVGAAQTKVRWGMTGKNAFPMTVLGLFLNPCKMIEGEFDWGLAQLKAILEKKA